MHSVHLTCHVTMVSRLTCEQAFSVEHFKILRFTIIVAPDFLSQVKKMAADQCVHPFLVIV